ncbi:MAG: hypothetical protein U1F43_04680 [Myxococcota bacterium]
MRAPLATPAALATLLSMALATAAQAAEVTEIWSPFPTGAETVGLRLDLAWHHLATNLSIGREFVCLAHETVGGASLCPDGSKIAVAKDLDAEVVSDALDLEFRLALWRTLEARIRLPVVLSETTRIGFDDGVDGKTSLTAPYDADQVFPVPQRSAARAGLGDPTLALWGTPITPGDDALGPTVALGLELGLPLAAVRTAGGSEVGSGVFTTTFAVAGSARATSWLEPFARLDLTLALAASNQLYPDKGDTQTVSGPPQRAGFKAGVELVPWEAARDHSAVRIALGGAVDLVSAGRAPTALFDAIGTSPCSADPGATDPCTLTTTADGHKASGTTVEEEHLVLGAWLGVRYDVFETLSVSLRASAAWTTPHFLTFSDVGVDLDGSGRVESPNSAGHDEVDPDYVEAWDAPGSRFRVTSELTLGVDLALTARF